MKSTEIKCVGKMPTGTQLAELLVKLLADQHNCKIEAVVAKKKETA